MPFTSLLMTHGIFYQSYASRCETIKESNNVACANKGFYGVFLLLE